jgi:hypothetical protein
VPQYLNEFYIVKFSYYSHELVYTFIHNRHKPDFSELFLHHFVTNVLVFFSYTTNSTKVGGAVLMLHGISDIWTANMKMMIDFSSEAMIVVWYFTMLISFVYTRIFVFPFIVLK